MKVSESVHGCTFVTFIKSSQWATGTAEGYMHAIRLWCSMLYALNDRQMKYLHIAHRKSRLYAVYSISSTTISYTYIGVYLERPPNRHSNAIKMKQMLHRTMCAYKLYYTGTQSRLFSICRSEPAYFLLSDPKPGYFWSR